MENVKFSTRLEEVKSCYEELCKLANLNIKSIEINDSNHINIPKLRDNKMGIYIYIYGNEYLKIGKAWTNSDARWVYQHYNFNSSPSNLASSIKSDKQFCDKNNIHIDSLSEKEQVEVIKTFIKSRLKRINIIIERNNDEEDYFILNLLESWLHYKLKPKYEGIKSERIKK